ncbi:MAG: quinolinate synthase NadA, partial [Elioraea tepidiphila]
MTHLPLPAEAAALPVAEALPALLGALERGNAVLMAPPGAGKTSVAPLALLHAAWRAPEARILVHPECRPEVVAACDGAGSTSYLIREAAAAPAGRT